MTRQDSIINTGKKLAAKLNMLQHWLRKKSAIAIAKAKPILKSGSEKLRCTIGFHKDLEKNYFTAAVQGDKITITAVDSLVCTRCKREAIIKMDAHEIPLPVNVETGVIVNDVSTKKKERRKRNADSDI